MSLEITRGADGIVTITDRATGKSESIQTAAMRPSAASVDAEDALPSHSWGALPSHSWGVLAN
jgi:hypothetical protein